MGRMLPAGRVKGRIYSLHLLLRSAGDADGVSVRLDGDNNPFN